MACSCSGWSVSMSCSTGGGGAGSSLLAIPAALYVLWYVTLGRSGIATYGNPFTATTLAALPASSWTAWPPRWARRSAAARSWAGSSAWRSWPGSPIWPSVDERSRLAPSRASSRSSPNTPSSASSARSSRSTPRSTPATPTCRASSRSSRLASLVGRPAIPAERRLLAVSAGIAVLAFSLDLERRSPARRPGTLRRACGPDPRLRDARDDGSPAPRCRSEPESRPRPVAGRAPAGHRDLRVTDGRRVGAGLRPTGIGQAALEEATRRAQNPPDWLLALQPKP